MTTAKLCILDKAEARKWKHKTEALVPAKAPEPVVYFEDDCPQQTNPLQGFNVKRKPPIVLRIVVQFRIRGKNARYREFRKSALLLQCWDESPGKVQQIIGKIHSAIREALPL